MKNVIATVVFALAASASSAQDFKPTEISGFTFQDAAPAAWSQLEDAFGQAGWNYHESPNVMVGGKDQLLVNMEGRKDRDGLVAEWIARTRVVLGVDLVTGANLADYFVIGCGVTNTCGVDPRTVAEAIVSAGKAQREYDFALNPVTNLPEYTLTGLGGDLIQVGPDYIRLAEGDFNPTAAPTAGEFEF